MIAPNGFREFEISNTDNLVFFRGVNQSAPTGISVNDGEWHHLAVSVRIDAVNWSISLFIDTALVAQRTLPTYREINAGLHHMQLEMFTNHAESLNAFFVTVAVRDFNCTGSARQLRFCAAPAEHRCCRCFPHATFVFFAK
jgi:hypothetical protein